MLQSIVDDSLTVAYELADDTRLWALSAAFLRSLRCSFVMTLVISDAAATIEAAFAESLLDGLEGWPTAGLPRCGGCSIAGVDVGVVFGLGVKAGHSCEVPPMESLSGFSLASSKQRPSFVGLRSLVRDATGRDGNGFSITEAWTGVCPP